MYNILVVEDDREIRDGIEIYLKSQGYEVYKAADGVEGLEVVHQNEIHLAIVDVMMPRKDGIQMVMEMRKEYDFPVIMLSAKSEEVDKILGLNLGADDYMTKPFNPLELVARVKSNIRRYYSLGSRQEEEKEERCWQVGELVLDEDAVTLTKGGEPIVITPTEYKMLALFMKAPGKVFRILVKF